MCRFYIRHTTVFLDLGTSHNKVIKTERNTTSQSITYRKMVLKKLKIDLNKKVACRLIQPWPEMSVQ